MCHNPSRPRLSQYPGYCHLIPLRFTLHAITIIKFVGDPVYKDPISRLQLVIDVIDGLPIPPGTPNPLAYIDNLYRELIERTPRNLLATTLHILGTCIVCPPLPVIYFSHLLGLELKDLYKALVSLHSVINVPSQANAAEEPLRFFHSSFPDFLTNPQRSGRLVQDVYHLRRQLALVCFRVLGNSEVSYAEGMSLSSPEHWIGKGERGRIPAPLSMAYVIIKFASKHVWEICARLHTPTLQILRAVGSFDFRKLQSTCEYIPPQEFVKFLQWLDQSVRFTLGSHDWNLNINTELTDRKITRAH